MCASTVELCMPTIYKWNYSDVLFQTKIHFTVDSDLWGSWYSNWGVMGYSKALVVVNVSSSMAYKTKHYPILKMDVTSSHLWGMGLRGCLPYFCRNRVLDCMWVPRHRRFSSEKVTSVSAPLLNIPGSAPVFLHACQHLHHTSFTCACCLQSENIAQVLTCLIKCSAMSFSKW